MARRGSVDLDILRAPSSPYDDDENDDGVALLREPSSGVHSVPSTGVVESNGTCAPRMPRPRCWMLLLLIAALLFAFVIGFMVVPHDFGDTPDYDEMFGANVNGTQIQEFLRNLTSITHLAGTPEDFSQALWLQSLFISYGFNSTSLAVYDVYLNYPLQRSVSLLRGDGTTAYDAVLTEPVIPEDATSDDPFIVPPFNGYSPSGAVQGPLVYVNYGRAEDFEEAAKLVNLTDAVGIVRYGKNFRGCKVYLAEQYGLAGLLIYSDPAEDGFVRGPVYPDGPWRPPFSVQRGSIQFLSIYPGDPLTPGWASIPSARRISADEALDLPRIPVQPMGYGDATFFLEAMTGPLVNTTTNTSSWQGGLDFQYRLGPGPQVRLNLTMNFTTTPVWNVITRFEGWEDPDRWVIMGAHRDAWVFGAFDPSGASAALMEITRVFGVMQKSGWQPRRTLIIASWDAEEYGLIGSTEWCEQHADVLRDNAVAYINADTIVAGVNFSVAASPQLHDLARNVTKLVPAPSGVGSVYDQWIADQRLGNPSAAIPDVERLGSGSDFTPFLQHLGIPSMDFGYWSAGQSALYHSAYDSYTWMERFGDPTGKYHTAMTKVWGLIVQRLLDDPLLPFNMTAYVDQFRVYCDELQTISSGGNASLLIAPIRSAVETRYLSAAESIDTNLNTIQAWADIGQPLAHRVYREYNDRLMKAERAFLLPAGLPSRPWYKHSIYAPGLYKGYGAVVFPALLEAVEQRDWDAAEQASKAIVAGILCAANTLRGLVCDNGLVV